MQAKPEETILDLIHRSVANPDIGHGQQASVYNIADSRFPDYVLRVFDDGSLWNLNSTTSLTPVDYGYGKRALAPSVLQGGGVAFHVRQKGTSLTRKWQQLSETSSKSEAYQTILGTIARLPDAVFEELLENMNYLTSIGRSIEPKGDNLMLSDETLRWIDIGHDPRCNHLENVRSMIFNFNVDGAIILTDNEAVKAIINEKLDRAAAKTNTPHNEAEVTALIKSNPSFIFKRSKPIESLAKIPLSATPAELRKKFDEIEGELKLQLGR